MEKKTDNIWARRLMWVLWPSFLMAGVLVMLVFAMVDPQDLHWAGHPLEMSRQGIYTVAFFLFWILTLLSSAMTALLAMSPAEVNRMETDGGDAPPSDGGGISRAHETR